MRSLYLAFLAMATIVPMPAFGQVTVSGAPEMPPAAGLKVRATPQGDPSSWFDVKDYPADALRAQAQGPVGVALSIDMDGRVAGCTVMASSGSASLDQRTCSLLIERARFVAAFGKRRKPAPDRWSGTVNWQIPEEMIPKAASADSYCTDCGFPLSYSETTLTGPEPRGDPKRWLQREDCPPILLKIGCAVTVQLTVRRNGAVRGCTVTESSGSPAWDRRACAIVRARARFQPEREAREKWTFPHWERAYAWPGASTK